VASWLPWAIAACFAGLCIVLVLLGHSQRLETIAFIRQLDELTQKNYELLARGDDLQSSLEVRGAQYQQHVAELQRQVQQRVEEHQRERAASETQYVQKAAEVQKEITTLQRELDRKNAALTRFQETVGANFGIPDNFTNTRVGLLKATPDAGGKGTAITVWDSQLQKGILVVDSLAPLPASQSYQLWLFDPRYATPVSGGVFAVDEKGNNRLQFLASVRVETVERFAISVERRGGVAVPQGKIILAGN